MRIANLLMLRSLLAGALPRRLLRVAGWTLLGLYVAGALMVLVLRYAVLPQIAEHRADVENALSRSLRLPVSIGEIDGGWAGLRPRLAIRNLSISDAEGRPALGFENVEAQLAWSSIWHFGLRLHRLEIAAPDLDVRRDANGRLFVAGLEVTPDSGGGGFADWLLSQDRIVVRDASVRWHDERRGAPPLLLKQLNFDLRNDGKHHRFGFTAEPPRHLAARLDVRGDLYGKDISIPAAWEAEFYTELDYADLAVWRTWIDYPIELPRGAGGVRLWLAFAAGRLTGVTADLRLVGVDARLAPELPMLQLASVEGRLGARRLPDGYEMRAQRISLVGRDGLRIEPTDMRLQWREATARRHAEGQFETDGLDIGALAALAAYLPMDEAARGKLAAHAPRGRLRNVKLSWTGEFGAFNTWRAAGSFAELGMAASGDLPGFAGLTGTLEGNEQSGRLALDSRNSAIDLPAIFAEPRVSLDSLTAHLKWSMDRRDGMQLELSQAAFRNRDASGEASGRYRRPPGGGRGEIDLAARVTQAAGSAVWRYMPLVVGQDVRDWLRDALQTGIADEATLRLKGKLDEFPFKDGKGGIFEVKGKFRDATLRYASGWPEIRNLDGTLLFEGVRMVIQGEKGSISGVGIGPVKAEIPDLETMEEMLTVDGRAAGETAGFLGFIEDSPVGARIDHFTEDMVAQGGGELQLKLTMPLRHIADTKIDGRFRFANNRLIADPDLPPLTEVNGELRFTGNRLEGQRIRAAMFGMPLSADIATANDGGVAIRAAGTLAAGALRRHFGHPALDHLSGSAPWSGSLSVKKKSVNLRIESSLRGIASSLPEPFNKTTNAALPLVVERKQGTGGRDVLGVSLGDVLKSTLIRRQDSGKTVIERGVIAVGGAFRLPERGLLFAMNARHLDTDAWRRLNGAGENGALPITQVDLRADHLVAFGRDLAGVRLTGTQSGGIWKADIRSANVAGTVDWDGRGAGRISGHLERLVLPEAMKGRTTPDDVPDDMPAADLRVDRFAAAGKEFGALHFKAGTEQDGYWNATFDVRNDDATLQGSGRWRPKTTPPETQLQFKLAAKSIERLLVRLGYPDAVRRGKADLEGSLSWHGSPLKIDYPSLSGQMKVEATSGQFNKLEPGVGRLLGVISLQSLPRRLTLDFRDIFSEGFAFDGIAGEARVANGIMETRNLQIAGPAARVMMMGNVDLVRETQNLKVQVQPAIGETVATGVLLAHPVAGAAAWVFNKIFGNPFDVAFAYEYAVTGSWADPKVQKVGGPSQAQDGRKEDAP